jgi:hypothetical protein
MSNQIHTFKKVADQTIVSFSYEEYGIMGVGKNRLPIVSMDDYINHDFDNELHIECCKGLALTNDYKMGMVYGGLPPEEVARFDGHDCWSEILHQIDEHDPTGIHRQALNDIAQRSSDNPLLAMYKYAYFALGAVIPWFFACYLKKTDFNKKTTDNGEWTETSILFPKVKEYLATLPFKEIGRVLLFTTYPHAGVVIHRDSVVAEHKDHNINLFFDGGWRPSFIWNEKTKEKVYLEKEAKSYFFNNRDYHGVDPEPVFRYTLRVDGTFTDELCKELGIIDGYTWKWNYKKI